MGIDGSEIKQRSVEIKNLPKVSPHRNDMPQIDCHACKLQGGMQAESINKFPGFIRMIGHIITIPSALGMVMAIFIFFSAFTHGFGGQGSGVGVFVAMFIFCSAAVGGLLGWILLMKKKVFRCIHCGYILDRA